MVKFSEEAMPCAGVIRVLTGTVISILSPTNANRLLRQYVD